MPHAVPTRRVFVRAPSATYCCDSVCSAQRPTARSTVIGGIRCNRPGTSENAAIRRTRAPGGRTGLSLAKGFFGFIADHHINSAHPANQALFGPRHIPDLAANRLGNRNKRFIFLQGGDVVGFGILPCIQRNAGCTCGQHRSGLRCMDSVVWHQPDQKRNCKRKTKSRAVHSALLGRNDADKSAGVNYNPFRTGVRKKRLVAGSDIGRCHYEISEPSRLEAGLSAEAAVTSKQDRLSPKTPSRKR